MESPFLETPGSDFAQTGERGGTVLQDKYGKLGPWKKQQEAEKFWGTIPDLFLANQAQPPPPVQPGNGLFNLRAACPG